MLREKANTAQISHINSEPEVFFLGSQIKLAGFRNPRFRKALRLRNSVCAALGRSDRGPERSRARPERRAPALRCRRFGDWPRGSHTPRDPGPVQTSVPV